MTILITFNRKLAETLQPSDGDDNNGTWISSFDVPNGITRWGDRDKIASLEFDYPGGETGSRRILLDSIDPMIQILSGRHTGKILKLTFATPICVDKLPEIAKRLQSAAQKNLPIATKYNYLMVARVFENWPKFTDEHPSVV